MRSRWMIGSMMVAVSLLMASRTQAAFTDDFVGLRDELVSRSLMLSNNTDKIAIKQKKACDQSIVFIDKPSTSLATDIKTAKKVAVKMGKAFANEFPLPVQAAGLVFSNNMYSILFVTFSKLGAALR